MYGRSGRRFGRARASSRPVDGPGEFAQAMPVPARLSRDDTVAIVDIGSNSGRVVVYRLHREGYLRILATTVRRCGWFERWTSATR